MSHFVSSNTRSYGLAEDFSANKNIASWIMYPTSTCTAINKKKRFNNPDKGISMTNSLLRAKQAA
jgi:hypothetical protein